MTMFFREIQDDEISSFWLCVNGAGSAPRTTTMIRVRRSDPEWILVGARRVRCLQCVTGRSWTCQSHCFDVSGTACHVGREHKDPIGEL